MKNLKKTYQDFNNNYNDFTNYVMNRINLKTRRKIRKSWNDQYKTAAGQKNWQTYLLTEVNKKTL